MPVTFQGIAGQGQAEKEKRTTGKPKVDFFSGVFVYLLEGGVFVV